MTYPFNNWYDFNLPVPDTVRSYNLGPYHEPWTDGRPQALRIRMSTELAQLRADPTPVDPTGQGRLSFTEIRGAFASACAAAWVSQDKVTFDTYAGRTIRLLGGMDAYLRIRRRVDLADAFQRGIAPAVAAWAAWPNGERVHSCAGINTAVDIFLQFYREEKAAVSQSDETRMDITRQLVDYVNFAATFGKTGEKPGWSTGAKVAAVGLGLGALWLIARGR